MIIHRFPQNIDDGHGRKIKNPEWIEARVGKVCSSEVKACIDAKGEIRKARSGGGVADSVKTYVAKVAAERCVGYPIGKEFSSFAMEYGTEHEERALRSLRFETGLDFVPIGGIQEGDLWASCDGVAFGDDGRIVATAEIKVPLPSTFAEWKLYDGWFEEKHETQARVEGVIANADVSYLFAWAPEFPFILREYRKDEVTLRIRDSLATISDMVNNAIAQLKGE